MKNTCLIFAVLLLGWSLNSCSRDESVETNVSDRVVAGTTRSVGEALSELNAVLGDIESQTRSGEHRTYSMENVRVAGGGCATRAGAEAGLPDTMVYVVNFDGDEGFAVLGAQRSLVPVYAVTESGALDAAQFDEALAKAYRSLTEGASGETTPVSGANDASDGTTEFVSDLLAAAVMGDIVDWGGGTGDKTTVIGVSYGDWKVNSTVGPFVETKWDQDYPFNMSCPPCQSVLDTYDNKCAVGCVMVALGQVLAYNRTPTMAPAGTGNYEWSELKSVSNYINFPEFQWHKIFVTYKEKPFYTTWCQHLADFLYYLGDEKYCDAVYGDKTSSSISYALETMKALDPAFYRSARICPFHSYIPEIYQMLDAGKPMYARGIAIDRDEGHAWVIDGYMKRSRQKHTAYRSSTLGEYEIITTEDGKLMHCNWGLGGSSDGYFEEGVFHPIDRVCKDEVIEQNVNSYGGLPDLSRANMVILY